MVSIPRKITKTLSSQKAAKEAPPQISYR